jgi:hypothetical protein
MNVKIEIALKWGKVDGCEIILLLCYKEYSCCFVRNRTPNTQIPAVGYCKFLL